MLQLKPRFVSQVAQGQPCFPDQEPGSANEAEDSGHAGAKAHSQDQLSKRPIFIESEDHSQEGEETNGGE
jgi:hypothetical protein